MTTPVPLDLDAISWDDLRLFIMAARHRSFRRAGAAAGIGVSTLARRIEALETRLGLRLFHRMPDGIVLTETGERVFEVVAEMRAPLQALRALVEEEHVGTSPVSISVTQGMGVGWVIPRAVDFQITHPDIQLDIRLSMDFADVLRFGCQMAIQLCRPEAADVVAYRLGRMHFHLFAGRPYIERFGLPETLDDVSKHRFIDQVDNVEPDGQVEGILTGTEAGRRIVARVNGSAANLTAIEQGLGIGVLPTYAMAFGFRVEPVDIGLRTYHRDIWLTFRPEVRASRSAGLVIDWVKSIYDPRRYPWFGENYIHPSSFSLGHLA